ncbi:MAG: molecular chaperone HtpG [Eggerthellales bacterium]|nr:molecular chaperone HtpG [Eggerthellales bacterium]
MRKFKTESKKLLDLMINSIYTNKEIFLRELISNASDAVDKLYFKSLTDKSAAVDKDDLCIRVNFDKGARTIIVSDDGIGMTKDELDKNLGTIAHSDSQNFKTENAEQQGGDVDIIGQFGVGFYSSFMVADHVRVVSRAFGSDEAYAWESDGVEGYTIEPAERETHGTDVILSIKEGSLEEDYDQFLTEEGLTYLITHYSNYVRYPIRMLVTKQRPKPKPVGAPEDAKTEWETYKGIETINSMVPIWKRKKSDVTAEEYNEFYKSDFHDYENPARTVSFHAEGALNYDALLFIPSRAPYDMYSREYQKGLALYSSNVLIMEKCEDLVPDYFNFVRGIVDSQDLTLNISRETLQQNSQLRAIARKVEKKIKSELDSMREDDREAYEAFFENFGRSLKYGIYASRGEKADVLADLLLFYSAKMNKMVTLREYVEDMLEGQDSILYHFGVGETKERLGKSPIVKAVLDKGYDVLLCNDPIDEFCLQLMGAYDEKPMKNVATEDLNLGSEDEKADAQAVEQDNADLFSTMQKALEGKVEKVVVSTRLVDEPACLTTTGGVSLGMERVLSAAEGYEGIKSARILEINPKHPVFEVLKDAQDLGQTDKVSLYAGLLYEQSLLIEGLSVEDPFEFAKAVVSLMV